MSHKLLLLKLPLVHTGADLLGLGWMMNMMDGTQLFPTLGTGGNKHSR